MGSNPKADRFRPWGHSRKDGNADALSKKKAPAVMTVWPSGLRRWLKAPFRKGVGSNPTAVNAAISCFFPQASLPAQGLHRAPLYKCGRTVGDSVSEFRGQGGRFDA